MSSVNYDIKLKKHSISYDDDDDGKCSAWKWILDHSLFNDGRIVQKIFFIFIVSYRAWVHLLLASKFLCHFSPSCVCASHIQVWSITLAMSYAHPTARHPFLYPVLGRHLVIALLPVPGFLPSPTLALWYDSQCPLPSFDFQFGHWEHGL